MTDVQPTLPEQIRAAEEAKDWTRSAWLKTQLQQEQSRGLSLDFQQGDGEPTLREQIAAAQEAGDWKESVRLKEILQRRQREVARESKREDPETKQRQLDELMARNKADDERNRRGIIR